MAATDNPKIIEGAPLPSSDTASPWAAFVSAEPRQGWMIFMNTNPTAGRVGVTYFDPAVSVYVSSFVYGRGVAATANALPHGCRDFMLGKEPR